MELCQRSNRDAAAAGESESTACGICMSQTEHVAKIDFCTCELTVCKNCLKESMKAFDSTKMDTIACVLCGEATLLQSCEENRKRFQGKLHELMSSSRGGNNNDGSEEAEGAKQSPKEKEELGEDEIQKLCARASSRHATRVTDIKSRSAHVRGQGNGSALLVRYTREEEDHMDVMEWFRGMTGTEGMKEIERAAKDINAWRTNHHVKRKGGKPTKAEMVWNIADALALNSGELKRYVAIMDSTSPTEKRQARLNERRQEVQTDTAIAKVLQGDERVETAEVSPQEAEATFMNVLAAKVAGLGRVRDGKISAKAQKLRGTGKQEDIWAMKEQAMTTKEVAIATGLSAVVVNELEACTILQKGKGEGRIMDSSLVAFYGHFCVEKRESAHSDEEEE